MTTYLPIFAIIIVVIIAIIYVIGYLATKWLQATASLENPCEKCNKEPTGLCEEHSKKEGW